MEKKLIYPINGINYVLVEYPILSEYHRLKMVDRMKRHGAILQSAKPQSSIWSKQVMCAILVPESNLFEFNLEGLK